MNLANERIATGVNYLTADVNNPSAIPNPLTLPEVGPICTLILIPSAVVSK
ncbi:hypothetical protein BJV38_002152 [Clostridium beijerinckii]|nr:hypothetical protein [Clostridium beijerinckii]NRT35262.1 hypothetical protein [Clostridium beijerinckii]NRT45309.1 hypothetical protein [Clostridium beijerinckii]NRZ20694.1 hypothetical protein [Clostridium beijerinckii]